MSKQITVHKPGDHLKAEDVSGCFLCGKKAVPFFYSGVRFDEHSPMFFICFDCAAPREWVDSDEIIARIKEKFLALQAKEPAFNFGKREQK
jgi:hypothetical protein